MRAGDDRGFTEDYHLLTRKYITSAHLYEICLFVVALSRYFEEYSKRITNMFFPALLGMGRPAAEHSHMAALGTREEVAVQPG